MVNTYWLGLVGSYFINGTRPSFIHSSTSIMLQAISGIIQDGLLL